jgi:hypothetical protein
VAQRAEIDVVRTATELAVAPVTVLAALRAVPTLAGALARLTRDGGPLDQLAELRATLDRMTDPDGPLMSLGTTARQLTEVSGSLTKLSIEGSTLSRLADVADQVDRLARVTADLSASAATMSATLGPLQSSTETIGAIVDRVAGRRRRRSYVEAELVEEFPGQASPDALDE